MCDCRKIKSTSIDTILNQKNQVRNITTRLLSPLKPIEHDTPNSYLVFLSGCFPRVFPAKYLIPPPS